MSKDNFEKQISSNYDIPEPADKWDAEEFLCEKGICNHPHVQDSVTGKKDYEIADLMVEFANEYYEKNKRGGLKC